MANYCIEGMNGATYMSEQHGSKFAIVSEPGDYGDDGAMGVKLVAAALGLEIVYDGQGALVPNTDLTPVVSGIVGSGADWVWVATDPTTTAGLIGQAAAQGFTGQWSGNAPSWHSLLLKLPNVAELVDQYFTYSTYMALWGTNDSEGMRDVIGAMREYSRKRHLMISIWLDGFKVLPLPRSSTRRSAAAISPVRVWWPQPTP